MTSASALLGTVTGIHEQDGHLVAEVDLTEAGTALVLQLRKDEEHELAAQRARHAAAVRASVERGEP